MKKLGIGIFLLLTLVSCKKEIRHGQPEEASLVNFSFLDSRISIDSVKINSLKDTKIKDFYIQYQYKTVWDNSSYRDFMLNELSKAEDEGLEPEDYSYSTLKNYEEKFSDLEDSTKIKYDLLLTENTLRYINHISKGKLNPYKIYNNYDVPEKKVEDVKILYDCIDNNNFSSAIENCKPNHIIYQKLKKALKTLRAMPQESFTGVVDLTEKFKKNKKNKNIPLIKKKLMYWGDMEEKDSILSTVLDEKTQEALKKFQKRHGLFPDGVPGRSTLDALNYTRNMRIEQVIANLERWRWYKNSFGNHYLLINIPDYKISAIKDGDTIQTQRVVVGKDTRKTPILESKVSNINLNPNWTVPPTILNEDIFPKAIKNRNEFRKRGLVILDRKKQEVSPWRWKLEDAKKYSYVQKPGRNNSLGSMKINFPNKFSVYLHDTNHRDYFVYTYRSLSSGCVRLEKPMEMAEHILNDTIWSLQKIIDTTDIKYYKKLQDKKKQEYNKKIAKLKAKNPEMEIPEKKWTDPELKTIVVNVKDEIFIHQLYWTAWEDDGTLNFREDIYCYDHEIYTKLRY